jgi:hypothetical protein
MPGIPALGKLVRDKPADQIFKTILPEILIE